MKILVTGGAGFVGSHLTKALTALGHEITVLDNLETANVPVLDVKFREGSILDEVLIHNLVKGSDQVIHLAATVGVTNIMDSPLRGLKTNVIGSEIVIRNCAKLLKPILLFSTSEIYGKNLSLSLNELSDRVVGVPQKSRWSYSDSKAIEEAFAFAYFREENLPIKIVRLFNTVGPGQVGNFGMVIPRLMQAAIENQNMQIHGDGNQTRCFLHISDAINGILKLLDREDLYGEVFNLGNPEEISINQLASKIILITSSKSKISFTPHEEIYGELFEDMDRRMPDISKAVKILGWNPSRDIDEIIHDIYEHQMLKGI